jgi:hypothetical protein
MTDCRLIYRSLCADSVMPNEVLEDLVHKSVERNRQDDITGLLLLSGDAFLQVLEGPLEAVNRLFGRIMLDERHHTVELISFEQIGPTYFDNWNMYLVDLYDLPRYPRELFMRKYETRDGNVVIPDRLQEVYSLLMDARAICLNRPWESRES